MARRGLTFGILGLWAALLGACASVGGGGPVVGRYLGYVAVRAPAEGDEVLVVTRSDAMSVTHTARPAAGVAGSDVAVLGAWLDAAASPKGGGAGLGWRRARLLSIPPDCRLVVLVKTDAQLKSVEQLLANITKGDPPCVVKH